MCFVDQKDESFYTVSWACNVDGTPFVVAGGLNGILRVIDAGSEKIHKVYYFMSSRSFCCCCCCCRTKALVEIVVDVTLLPLTLPFFHVQLRYIPSSKFS